MPRCTTPTIPRRRKTVCLRCGYPITWADQRHQYGRAITHGLTPEAAKKLMPRCQGCTTAAFRSGREDH